MSTTYVPAPLRKLVTQRAKECCEYCLLPDTAAYSQHEIDHVIAEKHGGRTESENLALCCTRCNKHKGSDVASVHPVTDEIVRLYHPRRDQWSEHFRFNDGEITPLTEIGLVTTRLLQMNRTERIEARRLWFELQILQIPDS